MAATVAACALAWTVVSAEMPWLAGNALEFAQQAGAACPANAKPAPLDFVLKDVANKDVRLSDFRGKVILLDFWATWCGPCKVEIPWFIEFQQKYGKAGLQVIGISADDPLDKLAPFVKAMKMSYPVLQGLGKDNVQDAYADGRPARHGDDFPRWQDLFETRGDGEEGDVRERDQGVVVTTQCPFETSRPRTGQFQRRALRPCSFRRRLSKMSSDMMTGRC
jgi:thiol-disulfide isomerase/thioredoxin